MVRMIENLIVGVLIVLFVGVVALWIHSSVGGYQQTWSDAGGQQCGRFLSQHGMLLYQTCNLKSLRTPDDPALQTEFRLPNDFVVGTNPGGERSNVELGRLSIPFALPASGQFMGMTTKAEDVVDPNLGVRWAYNWEEYSVAYWFAFAILLLLLVVATVPLIKRRGKTTMPAAS
jgi:hypothetical protein